MTRRKKDPLRPLFADERSELIRLSRSHAVATAASVRARLLLAVADGSDYQTAAASVGRKSGDAVAHLVARFNQEGLDALVPRHGGGHVPTYDSPARERILNEARRIPTPEADGTATWSLVSLQKALRKAPDGLPAVSTYTLWQVLHDAGFSYQRTRSWCPTGQALRKRKAGIVTTTDPDTEPKKS